MNVAYGRSFRLRHRLPAQNVPDPSATTHRGREYRNPIVHVTDLFGPGSCLVVLYRQSIDTSSVRQTAAALDNLTVLPGDDPRAYVLSEP